MRPAIDVLALFIMACAGSPAGPAPVPITPVTPPAPVEGGQLVTSGNAVAFLPAGTAQYEAAIVFLPGLRDPATRNDLDSRPLVRGTSSGGCSIWCSQGERVEVRQRALGLANGRVALVGTTTLTDNAVLQRRTCDRELAPVEGDSAGLAADGGRDGCRRGLLTGRTHGRLRAGECS